MNSSVWPAESRILVIDDTVAIHEDYRKILGAAPTLPPALLAAQTRLFGPVSAGPETIRFHVDCVTQGKDGLAAVQRALDRGEPYAIAFVDMRMPPGWDGIETIRHLWSVDPALQVVICTAHSDRSWEETVTQLGTTDSLLILKKPFDNIEVLQLANALTTKWAIARRDRERMADLDHRVRQRTEELRAAEGRFTKVFHANPVPTTLQNPADGRYVDTNAAFLQLIGADADAVLQHTPAELQLWPETDVWQETLRSISANTPLRNHPARLRSANGTLRDVLVSIERVTVDAETCVLASVEDVTERLLLEKKLQHAQKMEAVGQLAAGVAHDFNNLLTVIQTYTALLLEDGQLNGEGREGLEQVRTAADRAAALTRQLLVFSRRQISRPVPLDLHTTVEQMFEMLRRLVPAHIRLECACAPEVPKVLADEANLEQVIINLVVNARDAMLEGGDIHLDVGPVTLTAQDTTRHPEARPGTFVRVSVRDTGCGMAPEVQAHLFEPFFTTKGVGKGTGLGLSTVYAIIRQHTGWIEVTSAPARGTRFDLFLPAIDGSRLAAAPSPIRETVQTLQGRGERILLVEDEPSVRVAIRLIAARAGYQVTEAADSVEARQVWAAAHEPFDLLLTDMVMPNGSGADLAAELRARHPRLKVVLSTGYSRELLKENGIHVRSLPLLMKPFTTATLLTTLRQALDAPA